MAQHFHRLCVAEVRREADDAVSIRFDVPAHLREAFAFRPGQHLTLRRTLNGTELRRTYSLCAGVDDGEWRIAIRELAGGAFSTWANRELAAGELLDCLAPDGSFCPTLEPAAAKHYLLIAAGSGITPLLSIAKSILAREPKSRVTLLYANRRLATTLFREALEDLKNRHLARFAVHYVFSREPQEAELFSGRLDAARLEAMLERLVPAATVDEAYLCGPGGMLTDALQALTRAGVPPGRIRVERFGTGDLPAVEEPAVEDDELAQVTVIADGQRRELRLGAHGASILDAARTAGLDLPYSCKSGVCSTCRARLREGTVRMARNFALMPADLEAGLILSCQAHPTSERVVVSFDDR